MARVGRPPVAAHSLEDDLGNVRVAPEGGGIALRPGQYARLQIVAQGDVEVLGITPQPHHAGPRLCRRIVRVARQSEALRRVQTTVFRGVQHAVNADLGRPRCGAADRHLRQRFALRLIYLRRVAHERLVVAAGVDHRPGGAQRVIVQAHLLKRQRLKEAVSEGRRARLQSEIAAVGITKAGIALFTVALDPGVASSGGVSGEEVAARQRDVTGDDVAAHNQRQVLGMRLDRGQARVADAPRRLVDLHLGVVRVYALVCLSVDPRAIVHTDGLAAPVEYVVLNDVIAAAEEHGARIHVHPREHVAIHSDATVDVVDVDTHAADAMVLREGSVVRQVMEVVVAHHVAAFRQSRHVAVHVPRPGVAGLVGDVMHLVVLRNMVIAAEQERLVRRVVDQVVRHPHRDALDADRRLIGAAVPGGVVVDVTVLHHVPGRLKRGQVAPGDYDAGVAQVGEVAADKGMPLPLADFDALAAHVANGAAGQQRVLAALDGDAMLPARFDGQPPQDDMRGVIHCYDGRLEHRGDYLAPFQRRRRPEIQEAGGAVQVPLAGAVQLAQQVNPLVGRPFDHVGMLPWPPEFNPHPLFVRFHAKDSAVRGEVGVLEVAKEPRIGLVRPGVLARVRVVDQIGVLDHGAAIDVLRRLVARLDQRKPFAHLWRIVRPAGQGHVNAVEEELQMRRRVHVDQRPKVVYAPGGKLAEVGDAAGAQVHLQHMRARSLGDTLRRRAVDQGPKARQGLATSQDRPGARRRAVDDRRRGRSGILGGERKTLLQPGIHAAFEHDGDAAGGKRLVLAALAQGIAGALQRAEGSRRRTGVGIVTIGRYGEPGRGPVEAVNTALALAAKGLAVSKRCHVAQPLKRLDPELLVLADKESERFLILATGGAVLFTVTPHITQRQHGPGTQMQHRRVVVRQLAIRLFGFRTGAAAPQAVGHAQARVRARFPERRRVLAPLERQQWREVLAVAPLRRRVNPRTAGRGRDLPQELR